MRSTIAHVRSLGNDSQERVFVAGRITNLREMSKCIFASVRDSTGEIQIFIDKTHSLLDGIRYGDLVTLSGIVGLSKAGELTIFCDDDARIVVSPKKQPPKEIQNEELILEERYLSLLTDKKVFEDLKGKAEMIWEFKKSLADAGFLEVQTPTLLKGIFAGTSRPFVTKSNSLDKELFLRGTCEYSLKQMIISGYDKIFEFGSVFRNESASLIEFPLLEIQESFADMKHMIGLVTPILQDLFRKFGATEAIKAYGDITWECTPFYNVVSTHTGKDILTATPEELLDLSQKFHINTAKMTESPYFRILFANSIFKKHIVGKLQKPVFITNYPKELSPLAKKDEFDTNNTAQRAYLFINGFRIGEFVSEENNPGEQSESIEIQESLVDLKGKQRLNLIEAMQYGMPPTGGVGININRLFAAIIENASLDHLVLFPHSTSKIHN